MVTFRRTMLTLAHTMRRPRGLWNSKVYVVIAMVTMATYLAWLVHCRYHQGEPHRSGLAGRGFLVDTPGCQIPDIDPFDETIRALVNETKAVRCREGVPLTFVQGHLLRLNKTAMAAVSLGGDRVDYCEYQAIWRPLDERGDGAYSYGKAVVFRDDVTLTSEFVRVACFGRSGDMLHANFHAAILVKPQVEALRKEAFAKFKSSADPLETLNFLIVGVDSVSRLSYMRHMPGTRRYLVEELGAVEMNGYNKVADNTYVNLVPMFAGKFVGELPWEERHRDVPFDDFRFLWTEAAELGYRTLFAEDAPNIAIFNYEKAGFRNPPADYYIRPLSLAMEAHGSLWSPDHHCVGARLETDVVLDWVSDFIARFSHDPHLAFAFLTRLTHEGINDVAAADDPYLTFFKRLRDSGLLANTVVLFYSDHGVRFGPIRETYVGKLEERLPFLSWVLPEWFSQKYPHLISNLRANANRLTTPFDVFETLAFLLRFTRSHPTPNDLSKRGLNLFAPVPPHRTCADAAILSHWCTCHRLTPAAIGHPQVILAANHTVRYMNGKLSMHGLNCAVLRLDKILDARRLVANEDLVKRPTRLEDLLSGRYKVRQEAKEKVEYLLTIRTKPGDALFETTVEVRDGTPVGIVGDISRINRYGDQSTCIQYPQHKKYCFCI